MVRVKTRYILVRLELGRAYDSVNRVSKGNTHVKEFPTRKDLAMATQDSLAACFGTSASDTEIQGERIVF